ncbi:MAG: tetratricopeptide repeat protein [Planctomycetota bacterium]
MNNLRVIGGEHVCGLWVFIGMSTRRLYYVFSVLSVFCAVGWGIENPAGISTVPVTSYRSGLIASPNPINRSGNLVITGNVRRGRHFRGVVPYRASTEFSGPLGSSSLDSFLRDSAGTRSYGGYVRGYDPYYSPTRTVTISRPGSVRLFRPQNVRTGSVGGDRSDLLALPRRESLASQELLLPRKTESYERFGLGPITSPVSEQSVLPGIEGYLAGRGSIESPLRRGRDAAGEQVEYEGIGRGILERSGPAEELRVASEPLQFRQDFEQVGLKLEPQRAPVELYRRFLADQEAKGIGESELIDVRRQADESEDLIDDAMVKAEEAERREKSAGRLVPEEGRTGVSSESQEPEGQGQVRSGLGVRATEGVGVPVGRDIEGLQRFEEPVGLPEGGSNVWDLEAYRRAKRGDRNVGEDLDSSYFVTEEGQVVRRQSMDEGEARDYGRQARAVIGPGKTFASYSREQFVKNMKAGEGHLKAGKYYRAADSYTLALVYEPDDAVAYAGKSHALLGAGEYMSSALFLSRALESLSAVGVKAGAEGELVEQAGPVNIGLFLSSFGLIERDTLESRIVEIEEWRQYSDSGELEFLLSYVYYQMGRTDRARAALRGAVEKMSDSPGVGVLQKAIEGGQGGAERVEDVGE